MKMNFNPLSYPYPSARNIVYGSKGMVATSQPLAAQAGLDMIKKGGSAVDAAIAAAACLVVTEPVSNGLGSDAFAIVCMKDKLYGLNASGKAPAAISIDKVKAAGYSTMPVYGWTPVTVPGAPGGWAALSKKFGRLSLSDCLAPAIRYATEGYPISPTIGYNWQAAYADIKKNAKGEAFEAWHSTFAPGGRIPKIGEMWASPDHAASLKEIGDTLAESFYRGPLAEAIAQASSKQGGYLSASDLDSFKPQWVEPISVNYRGYDVWELPPNGQGLTALIALSILKGWDFKYRDDAESCHRQMEAVKLAFAVSKGVITDPDYMKYVPEDLLNNTYISKLRGMVSDNALDYGAPMPSKGGTVYLATADGDGNMVSYIQSNYMGFGSGIVVPGTGIALQNRGHDFSLDPHHINCLEGGKRTYHTIIPGFLTKDGSALGPFGVMGGYMQPQGHVQVIMNSIDYGLNPQAALDAPRWQWVKDKRFMVESRFPSHIAKALESRGHKIQMAIDSSTFGRGQMIWRDLSSGVLAGGTEPRADGSVAAW